MTAQTPAQRKAAERQRHKDAGNTEVRGIFAPVADHPAIRAAAAKVTRAAQRKRLIEARGEK